METRDVILSCYATPSGPTLASIKSGPNDLGYFQPMGGFKGEPPLVITVGYTQNPGEKAVTEAYGREADKYKAAGGGSIIRGALRALLPKNVKVRTLTVITFSGGFGFAKKLVANGEGKYLDGLILLDGIAFYRSNMNPAKPLETEFPKWVDMARDAVTGKRLLILYHTSITAPVPNVFTTAESAKFVSDQVFSDPSMRAVEGVANVEDLERVKASIAPPPTVQIVSTAFNTTTKWEKFPSTGALVSGNYVDYGQGGLQPPDHIFAATFGQRLMWETFLVPRLNLSDDRLVILPDDVQPYGNVHLDGSSGPSLVWPVVTFLGASAIGYLAGRQLFKK